MSERYPHGECECRQGCQCAGVPGPAAELITRDGKRMRVCTRCTLPGDSEREWLLTEESPSEPFASYDALGFFCAAMHLANKREATACAGESKGEP